MCTQLQGSAVNSTRSVLLSGVHRLLLICHNVVVSAFRRRSSEMFQKHCTDLNYKICDSCYRGSIMSTFSVSHILQEVCHLVHLELYSV